MKIILENSTPQNLIRAIEENLSGQLCLLAQVPEAKVFYEPDVVWVVSDIPYPMCNGVLKCVFSDEDAIRKTNDILNRFRSKGVPFLWWFGPLSRPQNLGDFLQARGLMRKEDVFGMLCDLSRLKAYTSGMDGLTVELVRNKEMLAKWIDVVKVCFGWPDFVADVFFALFAAQGFSSSSPWQNYIGFYEGLPVSASTLFLGAGVAGIYNVSTVSDKRDLGFGSAVTLKPLHDARDLGFRVGILHSTELTLGLYRRLGFEERCKISVYMMLS